MHERCKNFSGMFNSLEQHNLPSCVSSSKSFLPIMSTTYCLLTVVTCDSIEGILMQTQSKQTGHVIYLSSSSENLQRWQNINVLYFGQSADICVSGSLKGMTYLLY